jgi:hypothetical protein
VKNNTKLLLTEKNKKINLSEKILLQADNTSAKYYFNVLPVKKVNNRGQGKKVQK